MRLKYYLRGLGLGIIFAVIIMMIGFHDNKQSMSDTEIIEKAKTLGMVEAKNISGTRCIAVLSFLRSTFCCL